MDGGLCGMGRRGTVLWESGVEDVSGGENIRRAGLLHVIPFIQT